MADITMCVGIGCDLRNSCYRFTAPHNEYRQSFSDFTTNRVIVNGITECLDFMFDSRKELNGTKTA